MLFEQAQDPTPLGCYLHRSEINKKSIRKYHVADGIIVKSRADIDREDHCSTAMPDYGPLQAPLTDSLRSDIVLLTSYLSGQQFLDKSLPVAEHLGLSVDISILLGIGNNRGQQTRHGTAVTGTHTTIGTEVVIFAENDDESLESGFTTKHEVVESARVMKVGSRGSRNGRTELEQSAGFPQSVEHVGEIISISPITQNGRKLLDRWDPRIRNERRIEIPTYVLAYLLCIYVHL